MTNRAPRIGAIITSPDYFRVMQALPRRGRTFTDSDGAAGIPAAAEEIMVYRNIALAHLTGGRVHLAHMSTAGAMDLIRRAKAAGTKVSAEASRPFFDVL